PAGGKGSKRRRRGGRTWHPAVLPPVTSRSVRRLAGAPARNARSLDGERFFYENPGGAGICRCKAVWRISAEGPAALPAPGRSGGGPAGDSRESEETAMAVRSEERRVRERGWTGGGAVC